MTGQDREISDTLGKIFLHRHPLQFIFFLVCIFEDDRITTINEIIRNVKETPNQERASNCNNI